jgi:hypothetical protein
MKNVILMIPFFTCFSCLLLGQTTEPYKIPAKTNIEEVIPFDEIHKYPAFQKCAIMYMDGTSSLALINYNLLNQKMELINIRQDTGFLQLDYTIKRFDFGSTVWLNDKAFGLIETNKDSLYPKLGKREYLNVIQIDEGTTNGYSSFTDPTHSNGSIRSGSVSGKRDIVSEYANSNRIVKRNINFYIVDKNGRVYPARGGKIYKVLPRYKEDIKAFIKAEQTDFTSEESLLKLVQFCQKL